MKANEKLREVIGFGIPQLTPLIRSMLDDLPKDKPALSGLVEAAGQIQFRESQLNRADREQFSLIQWRAELDVFLLCQAGIHGDMQIARNAFRRIILPALLVFSKQFGSPLQLSPATERHGLAPRECQIIVLRDSGKTLKEISSALSISVNTVKSGLRRVLRKTRTHSSAEAMRKLRDEQLEPLRMLKPAIKVGEVFKAQEASEVRRRGIGDKKRQAG